jgi:transposase
LASQIVQAVEKAAELVPDLARPILQMLIETLRGLDEQTAGLESAIAQRVKEDETARRLMTNTELSPVTVVALAPPVEAFKCGRDFAAWVGLTRLQHSTGGKQKVGERTLRRLLIIGANSVLLQTARNGAPAGSWIARMLARRPLMLVRVALSREVKCIGLQPWVREHSRL